MFSEPLQLLLRLGSADEVSAPPAVEDASVGTNQEELASLVAEKASATAEKEASSLLDSSGTVSLGLVRSAAR